MAASNENCSGGYNVDVINETDKKKFECMLCLAIIKKATHGCSNHVFCFDCLQEYIESNERKEIQNCPAGCQQTFNINELSSNNPHDQLINQIDCKCPFCEWKGDLLDFIQSHNRTCEDKIIPCHLCGMDLKRKDMNFHLKDECKYKPMVCRWCQNNFPIVDHLKHEELCGDIKVQCSFTNFRCTVEDKRRNIIVHESNSCQQHLSLIANYFTNENILLRSENKQLKEETKQLKKLCIEESMQVKEENKQIKEENIQLKEESIQVREEIKQIKEENIQLKEENKQVKEEIKQINKKAELLETNMKLLAWKVTIPHILLTEPANKYFYFPAVDEMHIKSIGLVPLCGIFPCFTKNLDFAWIIEQLVIRCDVLKNYKQELHELFASTKTTIFNCYDNKYYFFQVDDFKYYKNTNFSLKKDGNIFYIENQDDAYRLDLCISKWFITTNKNIIEVDITKPDKQFEKYEPPYLSSKYFSVGLFKNTTAIIK